jgi:hypothetical protein
MQSGLAEFDSERIADSALDGARECIELAFGRGDEGGGVFIDAAETPNQVEACIVNVLADYALSELPVTELDVVGRP